MLLHSRDLPSAKYKVSHYSQNQIQIPAASLLICSTGLAVQSLVCRIRHWRWLNYTEKGTGTSLKLVCWRYHIHFLPLTQGTTSWALVIRANGIMALPRLPSPPSPTARVLKNQLQPVLTRAGRGDDCRMLKPVRQVWRDTPHRLWSTSSFSVGCSPADQALVGTWRTTLGLIMVVCFQSKALSTLWEETLIWSRWKKQ